MIILNEDKLRQMIKDVVIEALTVEMKWEKTRDEKTGQPLAVIERKTEKVFLPSFFCQMLPFYEGSNRGLQEQVSKEFLKIDNLANSIKIMADIMVHTENGLKCLAALTSYIKSHPSLEYKDLPPDEYNLQDKPEAD